MSYLMIRRDLNWQRDTFLISPAVYVPLRINLVLLIKVTNLAKFASIELHSY